MTTTERTAHTHDARSIVMTEPITSRAPTSTARAAGYAGAVILLVALVFHVYWGAGGTWGAAVAYGSPEIPPPAASVLGNPSGPSSSRLIARSTCTLASAR